MATPTVVLVLLANIKVNTTKSGMSCNYRIIIIVVANISLSLNYNKNYRSIDCIIG